MNPNPIVCTLNKKIISTSQVLKTLINHTEDYNQLQSMYWVLDRLYFTSKDIFESPGKPKNNFTCRQLATTKWKVDDLCRITFEYFDKKKYDEPDEMDKVTEDLFDENSPDTWTHLDDKAIEKLQKQYQKYFHSNHV